VKGGWTCRSENRVWDPIITWEEKVEDEGNLTQEINLIIKKSYYMLILSSGLKINPYIV
jgi:hypothetical protein